MLALLSGCVWLTFPNGWAEQSFLHWYWVYSRWPLPPAFNYMTHLLQPGGQTLGGDQPVVRGV